jgi:hypothetical protein
MQKGKRAGDFLFRSRGMQQDNCLCPFGSGLNRQVLDGAGVLCVRRLVFEQQPRSGGERSTLKSGDDTIKPGGIRLTTGFTCPLKRRDQGDRCTPHGGRRQGKKERAGLWSPLKNALRRKSVYTGPERRPADTECRSYLPLSGNPVADP